MNKNVDDVYNLLVSIVELLKENSILNEIIPFLLGLFSSLIGLYIGFKLSSYQEKRSFKRDCHLKYLEPLNDFIFELNLLSSDIKNIEKFGETVFKDSYDTFRFLPCNDYSLIASKIGTFKSYVQKNVKLISVTSSGFKRYYDEILLSADRILNVDSFSNICNTFEKRTSNYLFLIEKSLKENHLYLIKFISDATAQNLVDFNLEEYKKNIYEHMKNVNKIISNI